jgi:hypothetical protein
MPKSQYRATRRAAPPGAWLAFLALAVQALLPFLLASEIALGNTQAHADGTTVICAAAGSTTTQPSHSSHHRLADNCPICLALAAGQAFTTLAQVALPLPQAASFTLSQATAPAPDAGAGFTASYNPRAPPFIV